MAIWKSSLVQANHRLLVFINLPAVVLPSISQPSAGNLLELRPCSHIQVLLSVRPRTTTETLRNMHYLRHNCGVN